MPNVAWAVLAEGRPLTIVFDGSAVTSVAKGSGGAAGSASTALLWSGPNSRSANDSRSPSSSACPSRRCRMTMAHTCTSSRRRAPRSTTTRPWRSSIRSIPSGSTTSWSRWNCSPSCSSDGRRRLTRLLTTPFWDTVMDNTFDLVVVGTGAAASTVANRCRAAGWSVAIVDELPYGGTCQLRGCDPKKVLRRGAEVVDAARLLHGKGIATYRGTARFVTEDAIEIGGERLEARHVVIASGAEPVPLPLQGAEHVTTSDRFLELDQLPRRLLFIGGGYVSFEFAHLAAPADAAVVVLDRGERPLKAFD